MITFSDFLTNMLVSFRAQAPSAAKPSNIAFGLVLDLRQSTMSPNSDNDGPGVDSNLDGGGDIAKHGARSHWHHADQARS